MFRFLLFFLGCISFLILEAKESSRLLVNISPEASFTAKEFEKAANAFFVEVDSRNPYKAFHNLFLEKPFVVLSQKLEPSALKKLASRYGYRVLDIRQESLSDAVSIAKNQLETNPKQAREFDSLSESETQALYDLMQKIDLVLSSNEIHYWAGRETLLGAVLVNGLRPWDDYLYLFILDLEEQRLKNLEEAFDKVGLVFHSYWKGFYKVHEKEGALLEDCDCPGKILPFKYPAANIFVMTLEKRNEQADVYVHQSENFYNYWNFEKFHYSQVTEIHRVPFGPVMLPIPGDPETYLSRVFGLPGYPDLWKEYEKERTWDHRKECKSEYSGAVLAPLK